MDDGLHAGPGAGNGWRIAATAGLKLKADKVNSKATLHNIIAALGIASCCALAVDWISAVNARPARHAHYPRQSRVASTPVLAIISLSEQRISIYDAAGKILDAPVSTGATGHETPAGIYSILQKEEDHHSNLYDDASMPYMQRLTWTGMALHAGPLPGYAASHGCVRMPYGFAGELYQRTRLGLRVIVVPGSIVPSGIDQPALFTPRAAFKDNAKERRGMGRANTPPEANLQEQLQSIAAAKLAEAQAAARVRRKRGPRPRREQPRLRPLPFR